MRKRLFAAAVTAFLASSAQAQVFMATGPGGAIPDGGPGNNVAGVPLVSVANVVGSGPIQSVSVAFNGLAHTWAGDIVINLRHPDGVTSLDLQNRPGVGLGTAFGFNTDYVANNSYSFSDTGADVFAAAPPAIIPSGAIRTSSNPNPPTSQPNAWAYSATSLNSTFGGLDAGGNWTLTITDFAGGDIGSYTDWTITVTVVPEPTSLILVGSVVGGLGWMKRRKKVVA